MGVLRKHRHQRQSLLHAQGDGLDTKGHLRRGLDDSHLAAGQLLLPVIAGDGGAAGLDGGDDALLADGGDRLLGALICNRLPLCQLLCVQGIFFLHAQRQPCGNTALTRLRPDGPVRFLGLFRFKDFFGGRPIVVNPIQGTRLILPQGQDVDIHVLHIGHRQLKRVDIRLCGDVERDIQHCLCRSFNQAFCRCRVHQRRKQADHQQQRNASLHGTQPPLSSSFIWYHQFTESLT